MRPPFPVLAWAVTSVAGALAIALMFPPPPPVLGVTVGALVLAAFAAIGFALGRPVGLAATMIDPAPPPAPRPGARSLGLALVIGLLVGVVLLGVLCFGVAPRVPVVGARFASELAMAWWQRVSLSFEAAVTEEIVFRLALLSAIAWVIARLQRGRGPAAIAGAVWPAIILSALLFGLAHAPKWYEASHGDPLAIGMTTALDGFGGIVLGWMYVRHGLEAAALTHFGADVVLHVAGPMVLRG